MKRTDRRRPEYKVFGVAAIVQPDEIYKGVVWHTMKARPRRFPVAMVELEIV